MKCTKNNIKKKWSNISILFLLLQTFPAFASSSEAGKQSLSSDNPQHIILDNGINMELARFPLLDGSDLKRDGTCIKFMGEKLDLSIAKFEIINGVRTSQMLFPPNCKYCAKIIDIGGHVYQVVAMDRFSDFLKKLNQVGPKLEELNDTNFWISHPDIQERKAILANIFVGLEENLEFLASKEFILPSYIEGYPKFNERLSILLKSLQIFDHTEKYYPLSDLLSKHRTMNLNDNLLELGISDSTDLILDEQSTDQSRYRITGLLSEALEDSSKDYYLKLKADQLPSEVGSSIYLHIEDENGEIKTPFVVRIEKEEKNYKLYVSSIMISFFENSIESDTFLGEYIDFMNVYLTNLLTLLERKPNIFHRYNDIYNYRQVDIHSEDYHAGEYPFRRLSQRIGEKMTGLPESSIAGDISSAQMLEKYSNAKQSLDYLSRRLG